MLKSGKDITWLEGEFRKKTGYDVKVLSIQEEFFSIMLDPEHGFGRNLNPCIDCKIAMLKKACVVIGNALFWPFLGNSRKKP